MHINAFKLTVVSDEDVEKRLLALSVSKAIGCDNISAKCFRDVAEVVCSPLACIKHLSLKSSTVPEDFKTARVVPVYKQEEKTCEGNYIDQSQFCLLCQQF